MANPTIMAASGCFRRVRKIWWETRPTMATRNQSSKKPRNAGAGVGRPRELLRDDPFRRSARPDQEPSADRDQWHGEKAWLARDPPGDNSDQACGGERREKITVPPLAAQQDLIRTGLCSGRSWFEDPGLVCEEIPPGLDFRAYNRSQMVHDSGPLFDLKVAKFDRGLLPLIAKHDAAAGVGFSSSPRSLPASRSPFAPDNASSHDPRSVDRQFCSQGKPLESRAIALS